jgi:TM2 domain-containing membrane protein YozV
MIGMSYNWELSITNIFKKFIAFISIKKVDKFYMKQIVNTIVYEKISHVGIFELLSFFYF